MGSYGVMGCVLGSSRPVYISLLTEYGASRLRQSGYPVSHLNQWPSSKFFHRSSMVAFICTDPRSLLPPPCPLFPLDQFFTFLLKNGFSCFPFLDPSSVHRLLYLWIRCSIDIPSFRGVSNNGKWFRHSEDPRSSTWIIPQARNKLSNLFASVCTLSSLSLRIFDLVGHAFIRRWRDQREEAQNGLERHAQSGWMARCIRGSKRLRGTSLCWLQAHGGTSAVRGFSHRGICSRYDASPFLNSIVPPYRLERKACSTRLML